MVAPSDKICVVFTSGSMGMPKGAVLTHRNFSTATVNHVALYNLTSRSEIYDFASYSFDFAYSNLLLALVSGGCLCIPSEAQRINDLTGSIDRFQATFIFVTLSIIRALHLDRLPYLKTIVFGGETLCQEDIHHWFGRMKALFSIYGPCEATVLATCLAIQNSADNMRNIGSGVVTTLWVADTNTGSRLAAIGEEGELYLEGPLVGFGYLSDPKKTAAAFVDDPPWLLRGGPSHEGRRGQLYRTGDLVRWDLDGTLFFAGRKDAQVKIRGQRVELGEVEHHVRKNLIYNGKIHVVAELISPQGSITPKLVTFLAIDGAGMLEDELQAVIKKITARLEYKLTSTVPQYMVPTAYIAVTRMPLTATGKTDRRQLREIGRSLTLEQLAALTSRSDERAPTMEIEVRLQNLWAAVLGIDANKIGLDDSFLQIGGDSIEAMRLVGAAREQNLILTVKDVFQQPRLYDLAKIVGQRLVDQKVVLSEKPIEPFSLLKSSIDARDACSRVATLYGVKPTRVEDIFPCTPLQEGLLALTARRAGDYISRNIFELQRNIDRDRFHKAWETVAVVTPILRTRIVDLVEQGLVQVVVNEQMQWSSGDGVSDLDAYIQVDEQSVMGLGTRLTWCKLVEEQGSGRRYLMWTVHHALCDGWSVPLILERVEKAYAEERLSPTPSFQAFVQYVMGIHDSDHGDGGATELWQEQLARSEAQIFPPLPSATYQPRADQTMAYHIGELQWPKSSDITAATAVRAAWSILAAQYTNANEAIFGVTVTGRQAPILRIEQMIGPTIATVPVRVILGRQKRVKEFLKQIQKQAVATTAFEQAGLQRIRHISTEVERGSHFQTLLVIQPKIQKAKQYTLFKQLTQTNRQAEQGDRLGHFNSYALMLECQLEDRGLQVNTSFDSVVIQSKQVERILRQFEHVLHQVCVPAPISLAEVKAVSDQDLGDIWAWNAIVPEAIDMCVHDLIAKQAQARPQSPAICAWDGELTYSELDALSTRLAYQLVGLGVGSGVNSRINSGAAVPLCFEKSMWAPVAILGVMKASRASVALDMSQPEARLRTIIQQIKPVIILSSATNEQLAGRLSNCAVIVVDMARVMQPWSSATIRQLPAVNPSNWLYIVFTSGSTGTPKGAIVTHRNFSSAVRYQQTALGFESEARVYDFASYAFDVAWSNVLHTLTAGGCLCIPSDQERKDNLLGSLCSFQATLADFTPSSAQALNPADAPGLKRLLLSGEPVGVDVASKWAKVELINTYGPAECTVKTHLTEIEPGDKAPLSMGHGYGVRSWIAEPIKGEILLPIGAIGELWLEGLLVGSGYLNDAEKTRAAFIEDPPWLLRGGPGNTGRWGRLYRTGDLARYNPDGTLVFIGRKDTQVKIRGQRVELDDVEHHVRDSLGGEIQVVAEMVSPQGSITPILVAFLALDKGACAPGAELQAAVKQRVTTQLEERLANVLPVYMVPTAYIPVDKIPMTATGKTDRRWLREIGSSFTLE